MKALVLWKPALQFNAITEAGFWSNRFRTVIPREFRNTWDESKWQLSMTAMNSWHMHHPGPGTDFWMTLRSPLRCFSCGLSVTDSDSSNSLASMIFKYIKIDMTFHSWLSLTTGWLSGFKGQLHHRVFRQKIGKIVKLHLRINAVWEGLDRVVDWLHSTTCSLHPSLSVASVNSQLCGPSN